MRKHNFRCPEPLWLSANQIAAGKRHRLSDVLRVALERYTASPDTYFDMRDPEGEGEFVRGEIRNNLDDPVIYTGDEDLPENVAREFDDDDPRGWAG
jgi:hypothetical protein